MNEIVHGIFIREKERLRYLLYQYTFVLNEGNYVDRIESYHTSDWKHFH